jgi:DNA-binding MarR family transcriptional regulator
MPAAALDPVIHAPLRLQICAILTGAGEGTVDFATVREILEVSESVLSKHVKQLEEAGYVAVSKITSAQRSRTWLSMTAAGRKAFAAHAAALRALVGDAGRLVAE